MRNKKILPFIFLVCLSAGCFPVQDSSQLKPTYPVMNLTGPVNTSLRAGAIGGGFVDTGQFMASEAVAYKNISSKAVAGVVNHHVLAIDLLAEFFKSLKQSRPDIKTFIILSPDHFSRGHGISLSNLAYATPAGRVDVNGELFESLKNLGYWDGTASRIFEDEHGVGALAPFMAREFPEADLVPVFLRSDVSLKQAHKLGQDLAGLKPDRVMLIVSSDMSHFLNSDKARDRDRQTLDWLKNMNFDQLKKATDANTDSSASFAVLEAYLQSLDSGKKSSDYHFQMISHKSSLDYNQDPGNTTTYITGIWY